MDALYGCLLRARLSAFPRVGFRMGSKRDCIQALVGKLRDSEDQYIPLFPGEALTALFGHMC